MVIFTCDKQLTFNRRAFICWLALDYIRKKPLDQYSQNSVESWHMGEGRNDRILVVIGTTYSFIVGLGLGDGLLTIGKQVLPHDVQKRSLVHLN